MSTNEAAWGTPGLAPDLPDPEVLARMAAEFFGRFPGTEEAAQSLVPIPPQGSPINPAAPVPANLGPVESRGAVHPTVLHVPQPSTPAIPSSAGTFDSTAAPAFSFLEEARPLFGGSEALAGPYIGAPLSSATQKTPGGAQPGR